MLFNSDHLKYQFINNRVRNWKTIINHKLNIEKPQNYLIF